MKWSLPVRSGPVKSVLSLVLKPDFCDWLLVNARAKGHIECTSLIDSGRIESNSQLFNEQGLLNESGFSALTDGLALSVESKGHAFSNVVIAIPSVNSFQSELVVSQDEPDADIRFQIEDMLSEVVGDKGEAMAYDWQDKPVVTVTGERALAVTAILQEQLDLIEQVCARRKWACIGVTLDAIACANGHLRTSPQAEEEGKCLLLGTLSARQVKLSVFMSGVLFSENVAAQEQDFSVVQAVSALEKLVQSWTRGGGEAGGGVRLYISGPLCQTRAVYQTARRSLALGKYMIQSTPILGLEEEWATQVVAFGALEGLPCA